jgi:prolyl-tRNA editing enzyme YbaK/EbsC (Cys-tRNA(Pro) deacylase)
VEALVVQLTPQDLQQYLDQTGIEAQLIRDIGDTPTVPAAAAALGVAPEQIVKTLLFLVEQPGSDSDEPQPVVVISNGESRVDKRPLADHFNVGKKRIKLAPAEVVLALLGFPAGGVPPFGHRTQLPVILDAAIIATGAEHAGVIFGGGGDDRTMMRLTVDELCRVVQPHIMAVS